eukprot:SAG22_NODE_10839_length_513_cov_3.260870_1_plen_78_part_00
MYTLSTIAVPFSDRAGGNLGERGGDWWAGWRAGWRADWTANQVGGGGRRRWATKGGAQRRGTAGTDIGAGDAGNPGS